MTVAISTPRKTQTGPQVAPWSTAIPFQFFDSEEIEVRNVTVDGVETVLVEGSDYTITGGAGGTGTLNGLANIAATSRWVLTRMTVQTQDTNYQELDRFPADSHEEGLDRLTMLVQELDDLVRNRTMRVPRGDDLTVDLLMPRKEDRASRYLFFNADGEPTAVVSVETGGTLTASAYMLNTFFALANGAAVLAEIDGVENGGSFAKAQRGTAAARAGVTAVSFGTGLWVETDTDRIYQSDGAAWTEVLIRRGLHAALPNTAGILSYATDRRQLYVGAGASKAKIRHLPPGHLAGCMISRSGATEITFGTGACRNLLATGAGNAADDLNIVMAAVRRKDFSAAWTEGDVQGGLHSHPVLANQQYHAFVLGKEDGTFDAGFDTDVAGAALLAISGAAGFSWARRVGSFKTNGAGQIVEFIQLPGGHFLFTNVGALTLDHTDGADVDYVPGIAIDLPNAPAGLKTLAKIRFTLVNATNNQVFSWSSLDAAAAEPPATPIVPLWTGHYVFGGGIAQSSPSEVDVWTNAASPAQVRFSNQVAGDAAIRLHALVIGWYDDRGRDLVA